MTSRCRKKAEALHDAILGWSTPWFIRSYTRNSDQSSLVVPLSSGCFPLHVRAMVDACMGD